MVSEAVRAWLRVCAGAKTIAFCVDIPHSEALACAFREAGVHASHIDGGTPDKCECVYVGVCAFEWLVWRLVSKLLRALIGDLGDC